MPLQLLAIMVVPLALLLPGERSGAIKAVVVDAGHQPVPSARVSVSRLDQRGAAREVDSKQVNEMGVAVFRDLPPAKYMVNAIVKQGGKSIGVAQKVDVFADSVSFAIIVIDPKKAVAFPDQSKSGEPEYRMRYVIPDTAREEHMPIYNPAKKAHGLKKKPTKKNAPKE